jgi:hypothetical protein
MRLTTHPSRRSTLSATVSVALGLLIVGGMSTAAQAAQPEAPAAATASWHPEGTYAPYVSAEAEAVSTEPLDDIVEDAENALDKAEDAVAEAEAAEAKVAKKIAASKLKVKGTTTIDTRVLEEHIDRLQTIAVTPVLLLPATAEEAAAASESSSSSSSSGSSGSSSGGGSAASSGDNSVAGAKATARALVADRGWSSDQFSCLEKLWQKESGWNYRAYNSSSGAYGIPQALPGSKMASAGSNWKSSAATQIRWGLSYIDGRYGTPCGAWDHSKSYGWY